MKSQAQRIIDKFGNPYRLSAALKRAGITRNATAIYKWTYPRSKGGTDGLIPTKALNEILAAARLEGIMLTQDDLDPRVQ